MKIYITDAPHGQLAAKQYFLLVRPFLDGDHWSNNHILDWGLNDTEIELSEPESADLALLPYSIQFYINQIGKHRLGEINDQLKSLNIKGFAMIEGDYGEKFEAYSHIHFFRMGGFRRQLGNNNSGFPFALSDQLIRFYGPDGFKPLPKSALPMVGFCGHASDKLSKAGKEIAKLLWINLKRLISNPLRMDYEPLFPSAFQRNKCLKLLEKSPNLSTNIIRRDKYRAGAISEEEREQTTKEYYDNLYNSPYVFCVRGGGNFSVRFTETLMMGRIPVILDTDVLWPFENSIDWTRHCIIIPWKQRAKMPEMIRNFHEKISAEEFIRFQENNRALWKQNLSLKGMINMLPNVPF